MCHCCTLQNLSMVKFSNYTFVLSVLNRSSKIFKDLTFKVILFSTAPLEKSSHPTYNKNFYWGLTCIFFSDHSLLINFFCLPSRVSSNCYESWSRRAIVSWEYCCLALTMPEKLPFSVLLPLRRSVRSPQRRFVVH